MPQRPQIFRIAAIGEIMAELSIGSAEFARRANISRTLLSAWLGGLVEPQLGTLGRLSRTFGKPLLFFIQDDRGPDSEAVQAINALDS